MIIRRARESDLASLTDIYNYEVENGVATLDLKKKSTCERAKWLSAHNTDNHPLLVAEQEGSVIGYVSLSPYREKEAYFSSVELSLYVAKEHRRQGVATLLMHEILRYARENASIHTVVSVITAGNEASVRLHKKFGFTYCGTVKEVGKKFGKYLDIENYQLLV